MANVECPISKGLAHWVKRGSPQSDGSRHALKSSHGGVRRLCQTSTKLGLKGIIVDTTVGKSDIKNNRHTQGSYFCPVMISAL